MKVNGNALCLNFLNTISHRFKTPVRSYLNSAEDVLYWAWKKAAILPEDRFPGLVDEAAAHPRQAKAFFEDTMAMRSTLDHIFYAVAQKEKVAAADLDAFNAIAGAYRARQQVMSSGDGFVPGWKWEPGDFREVIAPVVISAFELLLSPRLDRVGSCDRCGWLFLDITKNGRRRWCSMEECGSAAKAKEYYHRHKSDS